MDMKVLHKIACLGVVALVATTLLSCSNENDTVLTSQQNSISKYLTSSHQPKLISEADIVNSLEDKPAFYTQWGLDIYRYIATYYDEGRENRATVERGSEIEIVYKAYIFTGSKPSTGNLYATNDATAIAELEAAGLNTLDVKRYSPRLKQRWRVARRVTPWRFILPTTWRMAKTMWVWFQASHLLCGILTLRVL